MALTVVDLFSGAGGFSAGFESDGFRIVASIDSEKRACETHANNFRHSRAIHRRIDELLPRDFCDSIDVRPGEIDVIVGGPPCQTFSTIGLAKIRSLEKRQDQKEDPRNYLFQQFFDYVNFLRPHIFVMENVPVLKSRFKGKLFGRILEVIDELSYDVHIAVLNAAEFGVPQLRRRLFIVGTLRGGVNI